MKNTKNLFLFAALVLIAGPALAQEAAAAAAPVASDLVTVLKDNAGWLAITAGFGMALATIGGATAQGRAAAAVLEGIARNPSASNSMFIPFILGLALIESLVILAFLVNNGIAGLLNTALTQIIK